MSHSGAVADGMTATCSRETSLNLDEALRKHAAGEPLRGDLIVTGPTGTNINDLFVFSHR